MFRQPCTYYCQDAGVGVDPFICNILVALTQSVFVLVSMLLVDRSAFYREHCAKK